jgi:hypothetical protein
MDIIERAARAMAASRGYDWDGKDKGKEYANHGYWLECARAAIEALREPDEKMLEGPWTFNPAETSGMPPTQAMMKLVWQAMIDQALKG